MEEAIAKRTFDDKTSHLLSKPTSLHKRVDEVKERAVDVGFSILRDVGPFSPRYFQIFDKEGNMILDDGTRLAVADMTLSGLEPQVVINYGSEVFRFLHWLSALGLSLREISDLRVHP